MTCDPLGLWQRALVDREARKARRAYMKAYLADYRVAVVEPKRAGRRERGECRECGAPTLIAQSGKRRVRCEEHAATHRVQAAERYAKAQAARKGRAV